MNISKKFNLNVNGHKDMTFIDVDELNDTRLYLDPYVIQALQDEFSLEAQKYINSFFAEVFNACKISNKNRLRELLQYASEPNETNLGMRTISEYGKGSTSQSLSRMFLSFYKIVRSNPNFASNPLALCMYIKHFDKDHMSDLITNIIRKLLYVFTMNQCIEWNIPLSEQTTFIGYYWDYNSLSWKKLYGNPLFVNPDKNVLLVPKHIVRQRYVFNVECYIKQYIIKTLQNWHVDNNTNMCTSREYKNGDIKIFPPTQKELYAKEVTGTIHKDYAYKFSKNNINDEDKFVKDIINRIRKGYGSISDESLDEIVYKSNTALTA